MLLGSFWGLVVFLRIIYLANLLFIVKFAAKAWLFSLGSGASLLIWYDYETNQHLFGHIGRHLAADDVCCQCIDGLCAIGQNSGQTECGCHG